MARDAKTRGIDPLALLALVENTAPFLFRDRAPLTPYTERLLRAPEKHLSHFDYFALCLSAHYTTVATFVPTDVDNQIRKHLWHQDLEAMTKLTLESLEWDFRPFTTRVQESEGRYVSGHQGEWFSVAVGAYASQRESNPALAKEVLEKILQERAAEAALFATLKKKKDGIGLLRASTLIAHNLGDLNRVIDQWELPPDDALRQAVYKDEQNVELLEAGALNKAFLASENHRHYPLRKPKSLRRSRDFLLPIGPFFDEWGEKLAAHPDLTPEEIAEVAEALLDGFEKLSSPQIPLYGYARALGGIQRTFPGGIRRLESHLPAKAAKSLTRGRIAEIQRATPPQFLSLWAKKALNFLKIS